MIKLNLQFKLLTSVAFIVLLSLFCFGYLSIRNQKNLAEDLFLDSAITLAQTLDAGIASRADLEDVEKLQSNMHKIIWLNSNITDISISLPINGELKIVASSDFAKIGFPVSLEEASSYKTGEIFTRILSAEDESQLLQVVTPVHVSGQKLGVYNLKLSLDSLKNSIDSITTQFYLGISLTTIAIIGILFLIIKTTVINPVKKLQEGMKIIGLGDLNYRIDIDKDDEIGDLADGLNEMTEKLKDRTESLAKEKFGLEGKVEKRTVELQERVDELERLHKLTIGREIKMIELKKEIKELQKKQKRSRKL